MDAVFESTGTNHLHEVAVTEVESLATQDEADCWMSPRQDAGGLNKGGVVLLRVESGHHPNYRRVRGDVQLGPNRLSRAGVTSEGLQIDAVRDDAKPVSVPQRPVDPHSGSRARDNHRGNPARGPRAS